MQRCPCEQYLAKIFTTNRVFTTQRGFIALEMAQGGAGGIVRKKIYVFFIQTESMFFSKQTEWAVCLLNRRESHDRLFSSC
jgi:hypothetical protein